MIKAGSITKGIFLSWRGQPVLVVDKEFYNPGKGAAVVRLKLKHLKTGQTTKEVLKTDENIEEAEVNHVQAQYLYKTKDNFYFMNPRTYDQHEVPFDIIGDQEKYLKENEEYLLAIWEGKAVAFITPKKMVFTVAQAEETVKGNTVTGATKPVTLDNGAIVKVPLFIKEGEQIIINTETGEYVGRKN